MVGKKCFTVGNKKDVYEICLSRTYTYIIGESGSGKTYLTDCIRNYLKFHRSGYFLNSDVPIRLIESEDSILRCDVTRSCIYIIDEDVCEALSRRDTEDSNYLYNYFCSILSKQNGDNPYPNSYFIFMSRSQVIDVNTDIMSIYELVQSQEGGKTVRRLSNFVNWVSLPKTSVEIALIEGTGSDYLFFKNSLTNCDVIPCGGKNNIAKYVMLAMKCGYKSILVFADGASYGYNLLLNEKLFLTALNTNDIDIRLYFPNSFEWVILASGLFKINQDILNNPQDYFDSKDFDGIEQFFTNLLVETVKDPKNRAYKFSALSPEGYKYYPERLVYSKRGSKSGYNHFVDVVLLSKYGIRNIYTLIGEVSNFILDVPMVNNRRCKNLSITSEKGLSLLKSIQDLMERKKARKQKRKEN